MSKVPQATQDLTTRRRWLRLLSRIVIVALAVSLALLLVGFIYDTVASQSDLQRYPPPGRLIDMGGYRLHLYCTGDRRADQPTVVLEAGSGSASPDWGLVQPEISKAARVCSYDRAGYAWSDPGPLPRTSQRFATELHTLLANGGEAAPYVLVGHSFGGHTVRLYAHLYPQEVVGMVLVDVRLEDESSNPLFEPSRSDTELGFWAFMARVGFFRLVGKYTWPPVFFAKMPDYPVTIMARPKFFETSRDEDAVASDKQVQASGALGDIPLIVIAHTVPDMFGHLPADQASQAEEIFQAGQSKLAELSTNGRFTLAEGSGHFIPIERPDVVIEAIRQVLQAVP